MPIDWVAFKKEIDDIIDDAAADADKKLAVKIASVTRMTEQEVKELFPEPADLKRLAQLMGIVKSAENRNTKLNNIVSNAEEFGGIILTLLAKFV